MLVSRDQNAGQNRDIKIGNRSFENVSQFKYFGTTVTIQRLNSVSECYHSVQPFLLSPAVKKCKG
jgi:hypothetical protein